MLHIKTWRHLSKFDLPNSQPPSSPHHNSIYIYRLNARNTFDIFPLFHFYFIFARTARVKWELKKGWSTLVLTIFDIWTVKLNLNSIEYKIYIQNNFKPECFTPSSKETFNIFWLDLVKIEIQQSLTLSLKFTHITIFLFHMYTKQRPKIS